MTQALKKGEGINFWPSLGLLRSELTEFVHPIGSTRHATNVTVFCNSITSSPPRLCCDFSFIRSSVHLDLLTGFRSLSPHIHFFSPDQGFETIMLSANILVTALFAGLVYAQESELPACAVCTQVCGNECAF